jgi:hypothetical protein
MESSSFYVILGCKFTKRLVFMQPQRIVLADGSRFLRDILRKVITQTPGLQLVSEVADLASLRSTLQQNEVEWIILSIFPDSLIADEGHMALVAEYPSLHILGIYADGSQVRVLLPGQQEKIYKGLTWEKLHHILLGN